VGGLTLEQLEVFEAVVVMNTVDVMHNFLRGETPAERRGQD
jgi:hypothetical protein